MNEILNKTLYNYLMDPKNPFYNFTVGKVYEDMGHTAAAASFYIRCGEFATEHEDNNLLTYEALLRLAACLTKQGSRIFTTKGVLLRAISLMPQRPEAYYLLSRMYEINKDWQEGYTIAVLGEELEDHDPPKKLLTDVGYPGKYGLTFERAVTGWWIGLWDESLHLFRQLLRNPNMQWQFIQTASNNLKNLGGYVWKDPIIYWKSLYEHLKIKFPGSESIQRNYSQCYQDMFVLTMLNGKRNGKFLEIGSGDPFYGNNTALLERHFEWTGISVDIVQESIDKFKNVRASKTICDDATKINYDDILDEGDYDYLQLDCDPAMTTYNTLLKIPFNNHRFAVITYEHDHYYDAKADTRRKSRKYLESLGYELVAANIAPDNFNSYEDWWVHPQLVDRYLIEKMKDLSDKPKKADKFMFGRYD